VNVPSSPFIEFDTLTPGTKGVVLSGIAVPEFDINDDGHVYRESYVIDLGYPAIEVTSATASVGLASIYASGSAFLFATDDFTIGIDPNTQNMTLTVDLACLGSKSNLSRIAYQVVATVVTQQTGISGTITFHKGLFGFVTNTPAGLNTALVITANMYVSDSQSGLLGGSSHPVPVSYGVITSVTTQGSDVVANYNIASPPYNVGLGIQVNPTHPFPSNAGIVQSAGPNPVQLTVKAPNVSGVNFIYKSTIVK
jgi:hypothetical protein